MSFPENLSGCRIVDAELKPGEKVVIEGLQKIRDGTYERGCQSSPTARNEHVGEESITTLGQSTGKNSRNL
jgi:hypothetical protein